MGSPPRVASDAPGLDTIRVASVPARHPYVRAATADAAIEVLPDPPVPGAPPEQWWPPVMLDASWIHGHADEADLLHVHFGTESYSVEHLRAALDAAHEVGWAVVVTVHDLDHPQLRDDEQDRHVAQLGVLLSRADAVLTLTPGAADEIARRWGRDALVVPHPRILQQGWAARPFDRTEPRRRRVATYLQDLRPGVDARSAVRVLAAATRRRTRAGVDLDVEVHLRDRTRDDRVAAEVRELCGATGLRLVADRAIARSRSSARIASSCSARARCSASASLSSSIRRNRW